MRDDRSTRSARPSPPSLAVAVLAAPAAGRLACGRVRRCAGWVSAITCRRSGRRRAEPEPTADEVADWCELVARSLRSGSSLTAAMAAGAVDRFDDGADRRARCVQSRAAASRSSPPSMPPTSTRSSAAGLAFTVLRSCARFGGPAAAPLERAAATLRARDAVAAEQRAQSAQARLSARVLTLVPIALLGAARHHRRQGARRPRAPRPAPPWWCSAASSTAPGRCGCAGSSDGRGDRRRACWPGCAAATAIVLAGIAATTAGPARRCRATDGAPTDGQRRRPDRRACRRHRGDRRRAAVDRRLGPGRRRSSAALRRRGRWRCAGAADDARRSRRSTRRCPTPSS